MERSPAATSLARNTFAEVGLCAWRASRKNSGNRTGDECKQTRRPACANTISREKASPSLPPALSTMRPCAPSVSQASRFLTSRKSATPRATPRAATASDGILRRMRTLESGSDSAMRSGANVSELSSQKTPSLPRHPYSKSRPKAPQRPPCALRRGIKRVFSRREALVRFKL